MAAFTRILTALGLVMLFSAGCSDDDCPTCMEQAEVLFYCGVSFTPESPVDGESRLSISSWFVGDPVPQVNQLSWLGRDLYRLDNGFPVFGEDIEADYTKQIALTMILDGDTTALEVIIPEPTEIITPQEFAPADEDVEVNWEKSQDAEKYYLAVQVFTTVPEYVLYYDTLILTTDTSYTVSSEYLTAGAWMFLQLGAGIGKSGEPGEAPNFRSGRLSGFTIGTYKAPWERVVLVPASHESKSGDAELE